jgi:hypothetical protein
VVDVAAVNGGGEDHELLPHLSAEALAALTAHRERALGETPPSRCFPAEILADELTQGHLEWNRMVQTFQ